MARRSLRSHGGFFLPFLRPGMTVLDCGCGPGTITLDIAAHIGHGQVTGVDVHAAQIRQAMETAAARRIDNARFLPADAYQLPFPSDGFDAVFSHALLEHLRAPGKALSEFLRALRPGGRLGACSPDWGGFMLAPPTQELTQAIDAYTALQTSNGGDVHLGRKLGQLFAAAGFDRIAMQARYEVYPSPRPIADYLALQLEAAGQSRHADGLRRWAHIPHAMFAQAWVSCIGEKP
jgi:ubiquinone/menaquinone biosynthesis C-methylase UbiE